jgi:hypothetical protein
MSKSYYSIFTTREKLWIYADKVAIESGCLTFYELLEDGDFIAIASFSEGYWKYFYEADEETGESIPDQIPFWKKTSYGTDTVAKSAI